jgi:hypothetical protein
VQKSFVIMDPTSDFRPEGRLAASPDLIGHVN